MVSQLKLETSQRTSAGDLYVRYVRLVQNGQHQSTHVSPPLFVVPVKRPGLIPLFREFLHGWARGLTRSSPRVEDLADVVDIERVADEGVEVGARGLGSVEVLEEGIPTCGLVVEGLGHRAPGLALS